MNRRLLSAWAAFIFFLLLLPKPAVSIPVFARKYNLSCFTCHTGFPTLNEFGQRFKANGYQIPGTLDDTPIWDSNQMPIALMAHASYEDARTKNKTNVDIDDVPPGTELKTTGFVNTGVDALSGGTLASHVSYFFGMPIEEGVAEVEQAYVILNNLMTSPTNWLNVKVGKFFLDSPFAENLVIPGSLYQTMFLSPVDGGFELGAPQLGVSVMGMLNQIGGGLRYEVGIFNGSNIESDNNRAKDFYGRVSQTFYVKNAPFRFAVFDYHGKQPVGDADSSFNRVALDVELYDPGTQRVYVYAQYMHGKDDDTDGLTPADQPFEFNGGFIGANVLVLPEQLILFTKYDRVHATKQWDLDPVVISDFGDLDTISSISVGGRYFLAPNVAFQAEFISQNNSIGFPANGAARVVNLDSKTFALGFDFDF